MSLIDGLEHIVRENEPLAPLTWFRLGGVTEYFAEPNSVEELQQLVQRCRDESVSMRLLGGGSNVLIRDDGVPGMVIHLAAPAFSGISIEGNVAKAGGGAKLGHLVSATVGRGLAGLEDLVGIPGSVGGALHNNSGGPGSDIGQWTAAATVMTRGGEIISRNRDDLHFAYRESNLDELVILDAQFQMEEEDPQQLTKRMQKLWIVKRASQPPGGENTGAIFKSSGGVSAGSLIEQAGLKGASIGEAEVSDRDANFIIAHPGATSQDVVRLIDLMRTQVAERMHVELETAIDVW